jgi:hypothetical protein
MYGPSIADDEEQVQAYVRFAARGSSPTAAAALWRMAAMVDVRQARTPARRNTVAQSTAPFTWSLRPSFSSPPTSASKP